MDPEFARDLRERMSASLGSLNRVALELLAERPSILFSHDTSWPDIRRHSKCVRETGIGSIRNLFALEKRRRLAFPTTSGFGAFSPFADREPLRDVPLMVCSWQPRIKRRFQRVLVPDHPDTWGTT